MSENKTNINWFPGHMVKTLKEIKENMKYIDIVCVILDSRIPISSNNKEFSELIKNKPSIIVLNKSDLADSDKLKDAEKEFVSNGSVVVTTNANQVSDISKLVDAIKKLGKETKYKDKMSSKYEDSKPIYRVLIAGIPNVGKSTLINKLSGKKSANVGNKPGVTKAKQWIRIKDNIELMDTPGVLWPKLGENDVGIKLALTGNIKEEIVDIEELALYLINYVRKSEKYFKMLKERYNLGNSLEENSDYEILEKIGISRGAYVKGGEVNMQRISKILLDEFKSGKIGKISFE